MNGYDLLGSVVAAAAGWLVGAIWYAPFTFGPLWLRFAPEAIDTLEKTVANRISYYALAFLASLFQAFALEALLIISHHDDLGSALALAGIVWAAFTASASLMDGIFRRRLAKDWIVDMGHRLLVLVAIALVLGLWPPSG